MNVRSLALATALSIAPLSMAQAAYTSAELYAAYTGWYTAWTDYFATIPVTPTVSGTPKTFIDLIYTNFSSALTASSFSTTFSWLTESTTFAYDASTGTVTSATPVPGPIAAAGLPAVLGLVGFAAWKRRRGAVSA